MADQSIDAVLSPRSQIDQSVLRGHVDSGQHRIIDPYFITDDAHVVIGRCPGQRRRRRRRHR